MNQQRTGQQDIERVRDATDLVHLIGEHITLRPRGREHVGLCPFHDDHTPSMAVVTHKGNAFFKCHACGAGGDAFDFVQQYHKLDFSEALQFLAGRAGIELTPLRTGQDESKGGRPTRAELREANSLAAEYFRMTMQSYAAGQIGRDTLRDRAISDEMIDQFMIGLAPDRWDGLLNVIKRRGLSTQTFLAAGLLKERKSSEGFYDAFRNRIVFPICNELGQPIAFGARKIDPEDEPKYLNSAESPVFQKSQTLYGLHLAKRAIIDQRTAIVTEGYTDVISCHQSGVTNVVGTLGTALTREHARLLSRLCDKVVLVFDGDEAGQRAADRGLEVFFHEPVDICICVLPNGIDPDGLLREEGGRERLLGAVEHADDALAYKVQRFRTSLDDSHGLSARQKRLEGFLQELASLGFGELQGVRKRWLLTHLADLLDVSVDDLQRSIPRARSQQPPATAAPVRLSDAIGSGAPSERADRDESTSATPSRARIRAERDLLALLVYDPSLHQQLVSIGEMHHLPVTTVVRPEQFHFEPTRRIAEQVLAWLEQEKAFTVQQLCDVLQDRESKTLAMALYFDGREQLDGRERERGELLQQACVGFVSHLANEEYQCLVVNYRRSKPEGDQAIQAACELIELRRNRNRHVAGAILRGVRS